MGELMREVAVRPENMRWLYENYQRKEIDKTWQLTECEGKGEEVVPNYADLWSLGIRQAHKQKSINASIGTGLEK